MSKKETYIFGFKNLSFIFRKSTNLLSILWAFSMSNKNETKLPKDISSMVINLDKLDLKNDYDLFRMEIRKLLLSFELKYFLRNKYVQQVMHIGNSIQTTKEFIKIIFYHKKLKPLLAEDKVGEPLPFWIFPKSSGNRIHHVYHLSQLFKFNKNKNLNDYDLIIEFGGGYGSFCRLVNLNNYTKDYLIFDFNDINILQYYYLGHFYKNVNIEENFKKCQITLISCLSYFEKYINKFFKNKKILFVSHWAISEAPIEIRDNFLKIFKEIKFDIFIAYQENFIKINNKNYFEDKFKNKNIIINKFKINLENHYYLYSESLK